MDRNVVRKVVRDTKFDRKINRNIVRNVPGKIIFCYHGTKIFVTDEKEKFALYALHKVDISAAS